MTERGLLSSAKNLLSVLERGEIALIGHDKLDAQLSFDDLKNLP